MTWQVPGVAQFILLFPLVFVAMWLGVTTLLAHLSGWFELTRQFPDRDETPLLRISGQSGQMGLSVSMGAVLSLGACPSGLRVGIMRAFGPFSRPFFVPWSRISVVRSKGWFGPRADLQFGTPENGHLMIAAHVANRLARAAGDCWPEAGLPPPETTVAMLRRFARQWVMLTTGGALLLLVMPDLLWPNANMVPVPVAVLIPVIAVGIFLMVRYRRETAR